jgi:hypothetical protein
MVLKEFEVLFNKEAWEKVRPILLAGGDYPSGRVAKGVTKFLSHNPNVDIIAYRAVTGHASGWGKYAKVITVTKNVLAKYRRSAPAHYQVKYIAFALELARILSTKKFAMDTVEALFEKYRLRGAKDEILRAVAVSVLTQLP